MLDPKPTSPTASPLNQGPTIPPRIGPYQVVRLLGQGGMGSVYLGFHPHLRRNVAIKVLPAGADRELIERFQREARAVARLRHKGIVAVHDVGEEAGRHFFVMDFIEGGTLYDLMKRGRMPILKSFEIVRKVVEALGYAHDEGVVHRDIKPQNIMIDPKGEPLLADFGLARMSDDVSLSRSGLMVGTPSFMAPEQARGDLHDIDNRSDLWAVGVTLYAMLSNTYPFPGASTIQILMNVTREEAVPLRSANALVPRDAEAIIFKCLVKERDGRYQDAAELGQDIDNFLAGLPVSARPVTRFRRALSWVKRNKAIALTGSLGIFGVAFTLLYFLWLGPAWKASARAAALRSFKERAAAEAREQTQKLQADLDAHKDLDDIITTARDLPTKIKAKLAAKDDEETRAVDAGLADYKSGPIVSQAYYHKGKWALAYRCDPTGRWGLNAQVEIARQFIKDLRLDEAALTLRRIRSRFPDSEAAKRSIVLLGDVLSQQGNLEGALAAYLESGAKPEMAELLRSILGEKQSISIPGGGVGADFGPMQEPFPILDLDGPVVVLPYRDTRPAYRLQKSGIIAVPSPLTVLPAADQIADLCAADFDGDGHNEVICTVYRPSQGGGYAVIRREGDGWKLIHLDLSNANQPNHVIAGDMNGDGCAEAFVTFMWRSGYQWYVNGKDRFQTTPFTPGGVRPWVIAAAMIDVDGDGHGDALLGRFGEEHNVIDIFKSSEGKIQVTERIPAGDASYISAIRKDLIGVVTNVWERTGPDTDTVGIYHRTQAGYELLARHDFTSVTGKTILGPIRSGRITGKEALLFSTDRSAQDLLAKHPEGFLLRFILGEPTSDPVTLGVPDTRLSNYQLFDIDGDGESELLALRPLQLQVLGRREGPPPKLPPVDPEPEPPGEAAKLIRAADDLIGFESFTEGRDLLAEIAERFPDRPESSEARRLRCDALLRAANLDFALAARKATKPEGFEAEQRAIEKCKAAALEARADAARFTSQPAIRRRFLLLAAEASRLALDVKGQKDDLTAALECARSFDDEAPAKTVKGLEGLLAARSVIAGDPAADALPFLTDCPTRFRRNAGALEAILDSHSDWFVAGVPMMGKGSGVSISMDLEIDSSVWSSGLYIGLFPRNAQPPDSLWGSVRLWMHGTTSWDTQGASFYLCRDVFDQSLGTHIERYRGRWKLAWSYLAEANLQTLELRDMEGNVAYRGRRETGPPYAGAMLFGFGMGYEGGDALLVHPLHAPTTTIRMRNVELKAFDTYVDAGVQMTPHGFELQAGGLFFRGDMKGAAEYYRKAIERDGRMIRSRLFLALATRDPAPIEEAFAIDPYAAICTIDDVMRGADAVHLKAMGSLLQSIRNKSTGLAKAGCLSFLGDWDEAASVLAGLPDSAGRHYLIRRNETGEPASMNRSWDWLSSRGMRTAGLGLHQVIWAPTGEETIETVRQELQDLSRQLRDRATMDVVHRAWVAASRCLIVDPDDVQILQFRAEVEMMIQQPGRAEQEYQRISTLRPKDPNAHLLAARLYARRPATKETLEFLKRAVEAGLRDSRVFDDPAFKFLEDNLQFRELRANLGQ